MISPSSQRGIRELGKALGQLREETRKDEASVLTTAGKGVARRAINLTPTPKNKADGGILSHSRKVIAKYFRRAARPLTKDVQSASAKEIHSEALREAYVRAWKKRGKRREEVARVLSRFFKTNVRVLQWDPDLVYAAMNRRGQVVAKRGRPLVLDSPERRKDLKEAQSKVGKAKAGWVRGLLALGGKAPAWIRKHSGEGHFVDRRKAADPSFEFLNRSAWADNGSEAARIRDNAMHGTAQAMLKQAQILANKRLEKTARKAR